MTRLVSALVIVVPALPLTTALLAQLAWRPKAADWINRGGAITTFVAAAVLVIVGFVHVAAPPAGGWYAVDAAACVLVAVVAVVGTLSALISPVYLAGAGRGMFTALRSRRYYYAGLHVFWASILILPLLSNLGLTWIVIEVSTGASALLVAFSGKATALEAGWKYLVLTTFGLAVALLGILVLYTSVTVHGGSLHALDFSVITAAAPRIAVTRATLAFLLITAGLATKIGWAPVHNWLPDAHSEAPPPVSAMLSAALLPAVILVAWRTLAALSPALHAGVGHGLFIGFGLCSLALSVPFLWRSQALKRLLAYSSLEHMGVIALGIGFGSPLALAGVVLHLGGHALAKSLGFYTAIPLQRHQPATAREPVTGLVQAGPGAATAFALSLGALSGMPPSPLFFSELLILLGGFQSGHVAVACVATALLALGFLGLSHTLLEGLLGQHHGRRWARGRGIRATEAMSAVVCCGLLALSACAFFMPGWSAIAMLGKLY